MSGGLARLNGAPVAEAVASLLKCCGCMRWAEAVVRARPFESEDALVAEAERVWWSMKAEDWYEAFSHHPRIGERNLSRAGETAAWAKQEQAGAASAGDRVRADLEAGNRAYEERFGHVYLVCATGKSAELMLEILQRRLKNEPVAELREAAEQQRQITRLRIERLLNA